MDAEKEKKALELLDIGIFEFIFSAKNSKEDFEEMSNLLYDYAKDRFPNTLDDLKKPKNVDDLILLRIDIKKVIKFYDHFLKTHIIKFWEL